MDHRILLEADYLANAGEGGYSRKAVETACERIFKTDARKRLLRALYLPPEAGQA